MAAAYDTADHEVLVYGGIKDDSSFVKYAPLNETWVFNGSDWLNITGKTSSTPPPAVEGSMAYDAADSALVLIGGNSLNQTWMFKHGNWTHVITSSGPERRVVTQMSSAGEGRGVLLFGGLDSSTRNTMRWESYHDTWYFANGNWTPLNNTGKDVPKARWQSEMTWDSYGGYALLWGGITTPMGTGFIHNSNDSWLLGPKLFSRLTIVPRLVDAGQTTQFETSFAARSGNLSFSYSGGPQGCESENVSLLSCVPRSTGNFDITVHVRDPLGHFANSSARLSVVESLNGSGLSVVPTQLDLGMTLTVRVNVSGGMPPYTFAFWGLPSGCDSKNASILECRPTSPGHFDVGGSATDLAHFTRSFSAHLLVAPPPSSVGLSVSPGAIDLGKEIEVKTNVSGGIPPYSLQLSGAPPGCPADLGLNGSLSCVPSAIGSFNVSVVATDAAGAVINQTQVLTIYTLLSAAAIGSTSSETEIGVPWAIAFNATGGEPPYDIDPASVPAYCVTNGLAMRCAPSSEGWANFTVEVADATGACDGVSVSLRVDAPLALEIPLNQTVGADVGVPLGWTPNVSGGEPPYRVSFSGLPLGCSPNSAPRLSCTPQAAGAFSPRVSVLDAASVRVSGTFRLIVHPPLRMTYFGQGEPVFQLGQTIGLGIIPSGGSPPIAFIWTGLPDGCASENSSNLVCQPARAGVSTVSVRAVDSLGSAFLLNLTVSVQAPARGEDIREGILTGALVGGAVLAVMSLAFIAVQRGRLAKR